MSEALTAMPGLVYYRAATLGSGSYGAVVQVYDDDGNEYAAKLFEEDEEESDDDYDEEAEDDDDDYEPSGGNDGALPIGVLREISILRFLNGAHPNIMRVQDVSELDQDGQRRLCMVMPKMQGDLSAAIANGSLQNKQKLLIAARLLHALSFMHSHGLIHRDIKPDNVLLDQDGNPVLADFSLAKQHNVDEVLRAAPTEQRGKKNRKRTSDKEDGRAALHTAGMGTPTYTAPEVVAGEDYCLKADVWSMGVVLLELFMGALGTALKNKTAFAYIEETKAKLGTKPLPALLRAMLETDPSKRLDAAAALQALPGVETLKLPAVGETARLPEMRTAEAGASKGKKAHKGGGEMSAGRACVLLEADQPASALAAEYYYGRSACAQRAGQLGMAACALLACKMHETQAMDAAYAESCFDGAKGLDADVAESFVDEYAEVEREVVEELGWCLALPPTTQKRQALAELNG